MGQRTLHALSPYPNFEGQMCFRISQILGRRHCVYSECSGQPPVEHRAIWLRYFCIQNIETWNFHWVVINEDHNSLLSVRAKFCWQANHENTCSVFRYFSILVLHIDCKCVGGCYIVKLYIFWPVDGLISVFQHWLSSLSSSLPPFHPSTLSLSLWLFHEDLEGGSSVRSSGTQVSSQTHLCPPSGFTVHCMHGHCSMYRPGFASWDNHIYLLRCCEDTRWWWENNYHGSQHTTSIQWLATALSLLLLTGRTILYDICYSLGSNEFIHIFSNCERYLVFPCM